MLSDFAIRAGAAGRIVRDVLTHLVSGLDEVVTQVDVADLGQARVLRDKAARGPASPSEADVLGKVRVIGEVWIDDVDLPPKKPAGVDYFSVVAFGANFVPLVSQLATEREVAVSGRLRSRDVDIDVRHVVTKVVVKEIVVLGTRSQALHERSHAARLGEFTLYYHCTVPVIILPVPQIDQREVTAAAWLSGPEALSRFTSDVAPPLAAFLRGLA